MTTEFVILIFGISAALATILTFFIPDKWTDKLVNTVTFGALESKQTPYTITPSSDLQTFQTEQIKPQIIKNPIVSLASTATKDDKSEGYSATTKRKKGKKKKKKKNKNKSKKQTKTETIIS